MNPVTDLTPLLRTRSLINLGLDETDPTRPAPLTIDTTGGVTLHWAPSTDDRSLRHYEVYEGGTLLTTTTATSYVYLTGPAEVPTTRRLTTRTPADRVPADLLPAAPAAEVAGGVGGDARRIPDDAQRSLVAQR